MTLNLADRHGGGNPQPTQPVRAVGFIPARPYSAVPHDLLRDRRLIPTDIVIAGLLLAYARDKVACWPSVRTLAGDCAKTRRTVQMSLRRLKDAGWVAERPSDNPTGRVLVLTWRERGAQSPAPTERNRTTLPPAQSHAPEWKNQIEKKTVSLQGGEIGRLDRPTTPEDRRTFFAEAGWLDRPPGDLLRQLAERRLRDGLQAPAMTPSAVRPARPTQPPRRRRGDPRRLFV